MMHFNEKISNYIDLKEGDMLYDPVDLEQNDIIDAKYHKLHVYPDKRDIACLPLPLEGRALLDANLIPIPYYQEKSIPTMKKSRRYRELSCFKDDFKVPLLYHADLEKRINEALISAYRHRTERFLDEIDESGDITRSCRSIGPGVGSSVKDVSLLGTAGTGKSTAVELVLSRYPKAIRHVMSDNSYYLQIPIIRVTAFDGNDKKSLFINLARYIDSVTGNDGVYCAKMMKCNTVGKMEAYLMNLIEKFHIGMIVIDEIQLAVSSSVFSQLLTITAQAAVSICIIGTEDACQSMSASLWFKRRFGQLGVVRSDATAKDEKLFEMIIRCMWHYQWTKERYSLNESIIRALKEVTAYNVDFLTTIYVTVQYMLMESEDDSLKLNADLIRKAARRYPNTTELIIRGKKICEKSFVEEKKGIIAELLNASEIEREKEDRKAVETMEERFIKKRESIAGVVEQLILITDYSEEAIRKTYERLYRRDQDFRDYDEKQKTKAVFRELMKMEEITKSEQLKPRTKKKTKTEIIDSMAKSLSKDM